MVCLFSGIFLVLRFKKEIFHGKKILVTRPQHQAERLVRLITEAGAEAVRFPVLEIEAYPNQQVDEMLSHLESYDQSIFISPNAVNYALAAIELCNKLPQLQKQKIWAIGVATEKALHNSGIQNVLTPDNGCNSEALLSTRGMQSDSLSDVASSTVTNSNIIIFRGGVGRNLLADTLRERGGNVTCADVYIRKKPEVGVDDFRWLEKGIDVIMITSGESLRNLFSMIPANKHSLLGEIVFLLGSDRIYNNEKALLDNICCIIAENPGDQAMMDALIHKFNHI